MSARLAEKPRLLFVDDERRVLNSMRALFRRDYELFLTTRGDEALKIISEQPIDVLVADLRMPIMTGVEVLCAARNCSPDTVRILLTGYADADAIEAALNDGKVYRLLNKPCSADELRGIIAEAVETARNPEQAPVAQPNVVEPARTNGNFNGAAAAGGPQLPPMVSVEPGENSETEGVYEVDEFDNTTTMEIVMSGDRITVLENSQPQSYSSADDVRPAATEAPQTEVSGEWALSGSPFDTAATTTPAQHIEPDQIPSSDADTESVPMLPMAHRIRDWPTLLLSVVGALLAIIAGASLILSLRGADVPSTGALRSEAVRPASEQPAVRPVERHSLEENLEFGALALDAGALIAPPGGSALAFYLDARAQAPDDTAVARGLGKLAEQIASEAKKQLSQRDFTALSASLDALATIDAADPALAGLRARLDQVIERDFDLANDAVAARDWDLAIALIDELTAAPGVDPARIATTREAIEAVRQRAAASARPQPETDTQAPQRPVAEPSPGVSAQAAAEPEAAPGTETGGDSQIDGLFAGATASLLAGRLTEPRDDSAMHYLREVKRIEPDNPGLADSLIALAGALVQRALESAGRGDWAVADMALTQADSLGVATEHIAPAREWILAAHIALEMERVVPVGEMQARAFAPPQYPEDALRNGKEGWVLLHFTVQRNGTVTDIDAVETSDRTRTAQQFVRAAVAAANGWEFEPRVFLGQTMTHRAQARVEFELAD